MTEVRIVREIHSWQESVQANMAQEGACSSPAAGGRCGACSPAAA